MRLVSRYGLLLAGVAAGLAITSCDSQTSVDSTVPKDGAEDVSPRSIIAVELSNGITADDLTALDPRNFVVTGDLTDGPYEGTVQLVRRKRVRHGMTAEQFLAELAANPDPDDTEEAAPAADPAEAKDPKDKGGKVIKTGKKNRKNTLVFLLAEGNSFKEGETIHVSVKSRVRANGTPLRRHKSFSFRVKGDAGAQGELRVVSSSPATGDTLVRSTPRITAKFNRAVKKDGLAAAITVRGEQSGAHTGGDTTFPETSSAGQVIQVARRLAADDAFLPGEHVEVAFTSGITDASAAAGASGKLSAYLLKFQVRSGEVREAPGVPRWALELPPMLDGAARSLVCADFLPKVAGVELLAVTDSELSLYQFSGVDSNRFWSRKESSLPLALSQGFSVEGIEPFDTDDDGTPEALVFLTGAGGSRLLTFKAAESGDFALTGMPLDLPVANALYLGAVDLDSNGKPELILSHESVPVPARAGEPVIRSGRLSFLSRELIPPNPADINPLDPNTALPKPGFVPTYDPIDGFKIARRLTAADFNADGKPDLVVENEDGLNIYRNISASTQRFAFRLVRELPGRSGGQIHPMAWTPADLDADGDPDLLAWDEQGALVYRNRLFDTDNEEIEADAALAGILTDTRGPEPVSGLPSASEGSLARSLDLDGAGATDLALLEPNGRLAVLLATAGDGRSAIAPGFEIIELAAPPDAVSLAFADADNDTGLDLIVAGGNETRVFVSQNVEPPPVVLPTTFSFAAEEGGLTNLSSDPMKVTVLGNMTEPYAGYTVALDYDERLLTYKGFVEPVGFAGIGSFSLCPAPKADGTGFVGCTKNASAVLTLSKDTRGPVANGTILGTFLFERKKVSQTVTTQFELESFTGDDSKEVANKVTAFDGTSTREVPAEIAGDKLSLTLSPPPPEDLAIECSGFQRVGNTLTGRVTWSSPSGAPFNRFDVSIGGVRVAVLPATAASYDFSTELAGRIRLLVIGRGDGDFKVTEECEVIGIHQPQVSCAVDDQGNPPVRQNLITWTLDHIQTQPVDRFVIFRNGLRINTTGDGLTTSFRDTSPSVEGGDNYQVLGVIGTVEGPRGACLNGPIGDPSPQVTKPPRDLRITISPRVRASDPNTIRCDWVNEEGYTAIAFRLERVGEATPVVAKTLEGGAVQFIEPGDPTRGGLKPGKYTFSVTATAKDISSETRTSPQASITVPNLDVVLGCVPDAVGNVEVTWQDVWQGYSGLKLLVEHTIGGDEQGDDMEIPLDLSQTRVQVTGLAPVGEYSFDLEASYTDPLPQELVPVPGALRRTCRREFTSGLVVGTVEVGVGMEDVELRVYAKVLGEVNGFHFELEFPSFFVLKESGALRVNAPSSTVETFSIEPGETAGTTKAVVTVSNVAIPLDGNGDGRADERVRLASIVGSIPRDFTVPRESPLRFRGISTLKFGEAGNQAVPADEKGSLIVRRRYMLLDTVEVPAGSVEPMKLVVRATFNDGGPKFHMNSIQFRLQWDPSELELLPVTLADQNETVFFDPASGNGAGKVKGTYIPIPIDGNLLESTNIAGDLKCSWLGFDLLNLAAENPEITFLEHGIDQKILVLRFRSKIPKGTSKQFAQVVFISERPPEDEDRSELITAMFPEEPIPNEPTLEGFFEGGLRIASTGTTFALRSITPASGPLTGGAEAVLAGSGFLPGGAKPEDLLVRFLRPAGASNPIKLDAAVLSVEDGAIRLKVPDSGLRTLSPLSTLADVQVSFDSAVRTLPRAFSYDAPRITSADKTSLSAAGGEQVVLRGAGFAPDTTAALRVEGVAQPFTAQVVEVSIDGTRLVLQTPDLRGQEGKKASLDVLVPRLPAVTYGVQLEIRAGSPGTTLKLTSVSPNRATICGGDTVTLAGEGFKSGLEVRFGDVVAAQVTFEGEQSVVVVTPAVPEAVVKAGPAAIAVKVTNPGGSSVTQDAFFTFEPAGPKFLRGDVNQSGKLEIADATLLSDLLAGKASSFPANLDAADANDDGLINGGDVTAILSNLFAGQGDLPSPFGGTAPGFDPTGDTITSCGP